MAGTVKLCLGVVQCLNFSRTGNLANIEVLKQPVAPLVQRADHFGSPGGAAHCGRRLHLRLSQTPWSQRPWCPANSCASLILSARLVGTFRGERIILLLRVLLFHLGPPETSLRGRQSKNQRAARPRCTLHGILELRGKRLGHSIHLQQTASMRLQCHRVPRK